MIFIVRSSSPLLSSLFQEYSEFLAIDFLLACTVPYEIRFFFFLLSALKGAGEERRGEGGMDLTRILQGPNTRSFFLLLMRLIVFWERSLFASRFEDACNGRQKFIDPSRWDAQEGVVYISHDQP